MDVIPVFNVCILSNFITSTHDLESRIGIDNMQII